MGFGDLCKAAPARPGFVGTGLETELCPSKAASPHSLNLPPFWAWKSCFVFPALCSTLRGEHEANQLPEDAGFCSARMGEGYCSRGNPSFEKTKESELPIASSSASASLGREEKRGVR